MVSNQPLALAPVTGTKGFISNIHRLKTGLVSFPDPPPKRKGGSGEYSTSSHYGLAVATDSAKSQGFEVSCWASVNWRVC